MTSKVKDSLKSESLAESTINSKNKNFDNVSNKLTNSNSDGCTETNNITLDSNGQIKIKKKRGRKPKIKTAEELERLKNPVKKKRGRKPKEKYNFNDSNKFDNNNNDYLEKNDSIIIRLPININDFENDNNQSNLIDEDSKANNNCETDCNALITNINNNNDTNQNLLLDESKNKLLVSINNTLPNNIDNNVNDLNNFSLETNKNASIPKAFDPYQNKDTLQFSNLKNEEKVKFVDNDKMHNNAPNDNNFSLKKKISLNDSNLKLKVISNELFLKQKKEWPKKTEISCLWCCHEFDNTPWGIPIKYNNNTFHLFGLFCSPNCCASYIFDSKKMKILNGKCIHY